MKRKTFAWIFILGAASIVGTAVPQQVDGMMGGGKTAKIPVTDFVSAGAAAALGTQGNDTATGNETAYEDTTDLSFVLHGFGCPMCLLGSAIALSLTPPELQLIEDLGTNCLKNEGPNVEKEATLQAEMRQMLGQQDTDWQKAKKIAEEFYRLRESVFLDRLECLREARNTLTPEQLEKMKIIGRQGNQRHMSGKTMTQPTAGKP